MTTYHVEFADTADADFDAIQDYIALDNPYRALTFIEELKEAAIRFLSATPNAGSRVGRLRYYRKGNYVVVYAVDEARATVRVVLVTEGHRNWRAAFEG